MVLSFLACVPGVLLQVRIQINCLHVHVEWRADRAVVGRRIVINRSVLGPLTHALTSLQHGSVRCLVGRLVRGAGTADAMYGRELLHAHLDVSQLYIPFGSAVQKTRSHTLSVRY